MREAVHGILLATGWAPIITGVAGSLVLAVWAWLGSKSALDITFYCLGSFASICFITWLVVQFVRHLRGQPMTLAIRDTLTLGDIATRWAAELENHPGALSRDDILAELLGAVWDGYFEDKKGSSRLTLLSPDGGEDYGEWNRQSLFSAVLPRIQSALSNEALPSRRDLTAAPDSTPKEWDELRDEIPWAKIKSLPLSVYGEIDRTAYIEPLSISKLDLRRWARKARRQLPSFWFE